MTNPDGPVSGNAATNTEHAMIISEEMHGGDYQAASHFVATNQRKLDAQAATAGSFSYDPQALVDLYNTLSGVHRELNARYESGRPQINALAAKPISTLHPDIIRVWDTLTKWVGHSPADAPPPPNSLLGNMAAIDARVVDHMDAVLHNLNNYLGAEQDVVRHIGKAAQELDAATSTTRLQPAKSAHPSTDTW